ncbi:MAG: type II toxin-antitoxin system RelE/ParE family toxin [bacterium]
MIISFRCDETEKIFHGEVSRFLPYEMQEAARRKLKMLHRVEYLEELRQLPGNHLEALHGNRKGWHSIRINRRWRVCFIWKTGNAEHVEIVDYH